MKAATLTTSQRDEILTLLQNRFMKHRGRHPDLDWAAVQSRLEKADSKLWTLSEMERTGGEPDVAAYDPQTGEYLFYDFSAESPKGRRSVCYDRKALESRKDFPPQANAIDMAAAMGTELLDEDQYRHLQTLGKFDAKTSSWLATPPDVRSLDGAIFGDYRYGRVFIYHNGAQSYYAARGFRVAVRI